MYFEGQGTDVNYGKAFRWFLKAAEQGYADAQNVVGMYYLVGTSVDKDYQKAREWLQKAAAQGHKDAQKNLAELNSSGY